MAGVISSRHWEIYWSLILLPNILSHLISLSSKFRPCYILVSWLQACYVCCWVEIICHCLWQSQIMFFCSVRLTFFSWMTNCWRWATYAYTILTRCYSYGDSVLVKGWTLMEATYKLPHCHDSLCHNDMRSVEMEWGHKVKKERHSRLIRWLRLSFFTSK